MKNRNVRSIADVSLMAGQPQVARLSVGAQQHRAQVSVIAPPQQQWPVDWIRCRQMQRAASMARVGGSSLEEEVSWVKWITR